MNHEWVVDVKDTGGTAVSTAKVALVQTRSLAGQEWPFAATAATHAHNAGGLYEATAPIVPVAGDWTLLVHATGRSPVVQPLKLKAKSTAETLTTPSPKSAATVAFSSEVKTAGTSSVRHTRFTVTLYPSSEIVLISGTEYHSKGTRFRLFAENHREGMRREKKVDDGVISTLFSTDDRSRETHVPAAGGGWLKVAAYSFGSTKDIKPGTDHDAVPGSDVSVVHLYQYLSAVGGTEPGRVKHVGFFSHSWPSGPILFDTNDSSTSTARDPNDFDARSKDFLAPNIARWPKLKDAMSPAGSWQVWGCSATSHHNRLTTSAYQHKKEGDHKHFTVTTETKRDNGTVSQLIVERTTRARIRATMDARFRSETYMAAAASYLGVPVFGAPPGVGASFEPKLTLMYIDTKTYASLYAYFKEEFGPEFAPTQGKYNTGYVNYTALAKRAAPAAAPFSSEYYKLVKNFPLDPKKEETWLSFANGHHLTRKGSTTLTLKVAEKMGFATAGKRGHLYELHDSADASNSCALYVQEDRKIFRVDKDKAGKFTVPGREL